MIDATPPSLRPARWEVGSEFDWHDALVRAARVEDLFPLGHVLFSTGRAALLTLGRLLSQGRRRRVLHLPSYFCPEVAAALRPEFDLAWYRDLPTEPAPDLGTLRPASGDVVLAVNLFGLRDGTAWDGWRGDHDGVIVVEDHSHDPLSPWAQRSTADYTMASLRKTLPIPDGAVLWSPQALPVPAPSLPPPAAAYDKLAAMALKRVYLRGADVPKDVYRTLHMEGERALGREVDSAASAFTRTVLGILNAPSLRRCREENIRLFLRLLRESCTSSPRPLFLTWPDGNVPYNPALVFEAGEQRDEFRKYLMSKNVYCPVHWQLHAGGVHSRDPAAVDLSRRLLTVPADHRYSPEDLARIVEIMASFELKRHPERSHRPG